MTHTTRRRAAVLRDYYAGSLVGEIAARYGITRQTVRRWVDAHEAVGHHDPERALTGGRWVGSGGILRWEPS